MVMCGPANSTNAQNATDSLSMALEKYYQLKSLPGFAVSIVDKSGVLYQNSFGFADLENQTPYTQNTVQIVASISKTTIAFAIMKLVEEGKLSLETPVNDLLPFEVRNPNFPDSPILVEHLVTHTSGILDVDGNYDFVGRVLQDDAGDLMKKLPRGYKKFFKKWKENEPLSLGKFCQNSLSAKGKAYSKKGFAKFAPGTAYEYSNLGASLAAFIVERVSGLSFQQFTRQYLFEPLKLKRTFWNYRKARSEELAAKYITEEMISVPHFEEQSFPDGGMYTSCADLSSYLVEIIKGYAGGGSVLKPATFQTMLTPRLTKTQYANESGKNTENICIFWHTAPNNQIWHNGGDVTGAVAYMWFDPATGIGRILMTNYYVSERPSQVEFISVWRTLEKYAGRIQMEQ